MNASASRPSRHSDPTPHLSHSRIQRYLHCPEQYRLYYVEGLRPRAPSASLVFGQVVHQALADLFAHGVDPIESFQRAWHALREIELSYTKRDTWDSLRVAGELLLEAFVTKAAARIGEVSAVERRFELLLSEVELPFVGFLDLVAELDGVPTVVDFKTTATAFRPHEVTLSDQLSAYRLAEPDVSHIALCVLVRGKAPRIDWHEGRRSPEELEDYLDKVHLVAGEIARQRFYKRPGLWCTWCDFLPVCTNHKQRVQETLLQIR